MENAKIFKVEGQQKMIADWFASSWPQTPLVHIAIQVNMKNANKFRKEYGKKHGVKVTIMHMIQKAAADACKVCPLLAGHWNEDGTVSYPNDDSISVGGPVQVGELAFPILLENASRKTLAEIAVEMRGIADLIRAQENMEEIHALGARLFQEPNLGISNIGMIAPVSDFIAGVGLPTCASFCVSATIDTPIAVNGEVVIAPMAKFYVDFDHRILQAGPVAEFLGKFKTIMENPAEYLDN